LVVIAKHESGVELKLLDTNTLVFTTEIPADAVLNGEWEMTATVWGWHGEVPSVANGMIATITVEVKPHQVHLWMFDTNSSTVIEEKLSYVVVGMTPLQVRFICPDTTTDNIRIDYGDGQRTIINRQTNPLPDFEHTHTYSVPGTYNPYAQIDVNGDNIYDLTNSEIVRVESQLPDLSVTFPTGSDFAPREVSVTIHSNAMLLTVDFDADPSNTVENRKDYSGVVSDPINGPVYFIEHNGDLETPITVTHTYTTPNEYWIRVTTNKNSEVYDIQQTSQPILVRDTIPCLLMPHEGFPPFTVEIDLTSSVGGWIELNPGDYRRVYDLGVVDGLDMANWDSFDDDTKLTAINNLWTRGMKLVTLEKGGVEVDYCVIFYKSNTLGLNGKPWVFTIAYQDEGQYEYEVWIYPKEPGYPLREDLV
jgi:hypothetical protein